MRPARVLWLLPALVVLGCNSSTPECTDECTSGSKRCQGNTVQTCAEHDQDGCLEWGGDTACKLGQTCRDGECGIGCSDECTAGNIECAGNGFRSCGQFDVDSCLDWSPVTPCPAGRICASGQCRPQCSSECRSGDKRCQNGQVQDCDDFDLDGCLEWGGDHACGSGESCQGEGLCLPAGTLVLYVSTVGNDAWSGRLPEPDGQGTDGPLASLPGARDAIRKIKAAGGLTAPVLVLFRQGTYRLSTLVEFTPEDSGTNEAPITYGLYPGEQATISGGRELSGWQPEGAKWTLPIPEVLAGQWNFAALWINGERRPRARTPNDGFFYTAGKADPPNQAFRFHPGDLHPWHNLADAIVVVYHSWATSLHHIASLDLNQNIVSFTGPAIWDFESWGPAQRYRVENVPEALDAPGEWILDRTSGVLSYLPLPGENPAQVQAVAPVAGQLLILRGDPAQARWIEQLTFQDLNFEHTDWQPGPQGFSSGQAAVGVPAAIEATGARGVSFLRCRFGHLGAYAVWFRSGSQGCWLQQCELFDLGAGGVFIGEQGGPGSASEEVRDNRVDNCFLHDGGRILAEGVGVWIGQSSFNQITHNEIADLDYSGVSVGWTWGYGTSMANNNLIAHNHIHHIGRGVLSDMGGIYTLGISPGTQLLHNHIHDVVSYSYGGWGLYNDEGSSNILLSDNLVYSTKSGGYHQHYGQDNLVHNNILAYSQEGQIIRSREEDHRSFDFQSNIVLFNNAWLLGGNWGNNQYTMDYNLYWDTSGAPVTFNCLSLVGWQALGHDQHSQLADPLFSDPQHFDFRLNPVSPAVALGFVPFPLDDFGLYGEPAWVERPKQIGRPPTSLPAYPPPPLVDDFESTAVGLPPQGVTVNGETANATIRVTDERAFTGTHSVKFQDAPGLDYVWNPHLFYRPNLRSGMAQGSFALRLGPGAVFYHEWRYWQVNPYVAGPSITIDANSLLTASGVQLPITIPRDTWVVFTIRFQLGPAGSGQYQLAVDIPGQGVQLFDNLGVPGGTLCALDWYGFVALSDASTVMYLDDLSLQTE